MPKRLDMSKFNLIWRREHQRTKSITVFSQYFRDFRIYRDSRNYYFIYLAVFVQNLTKKKETVEYWMMSLISVLKTDYIWRARNRQQSINTSTSFDNLRGNDCSFLSVSILITDRISLFLTPSCSINERGRPAYTLSTSLFNNTITNLFHSKMKITKNYANHFTADYLERQKKNNKQQPNCYSLRR